MTADKAMTTSEWLTSVLCPFESALEQDFLQASKGRIEPADDIEEQTLQLVKERDALRRKLAKAKTQIHTLKKDKENLRQVLNGEDEPDIFSSLFGYTECLVPTTPELVEEPKVPNKRQPSRSPESSPRQRKKAVLRVRSETDKKKSKSKKQRPTSENQDKDFLDRAFDWTV